MTELTLHETNCIYCNEPMGLAWDSDRCRDCIAERQRKQREHNERMFEMAGGRNTAGEGVHATVRRWIRCHHAFDPAGLDDSQLDAFNLVMVWVDARYTAHINLDGKPGGWSTERGWMSLYLGEFELERLSEPRSWDSNHENIIARVKRHGAAAVEAAIAQRIRREAEREGIPHSTGPPLYLWHLNTKYRALSL